MKVSDLIPTASGEASLGVNSGPNEGAFSASSIAPFNHMHMLSGVIHDPITGQSGVLRFSQAAGAFQGSIDGGRTFFNIQSNLAYAQSFTNALYQTITHNLNSTDVVVQVKDQSNEKLEPDGVIILDANNIILVFSTPQTGRVTVLASGGTFLTTYNAVFSSQKTWVVSHNLNSVILEVSVIDNDNTFITPTAIKIIDANTINIFWVDPQSGTVVIVRG
jgi:hypothetical protein